MKVTLTCLLTATVAVSSAYGQMQDNRDKKLTCSDGGNWNDRARHCDVREQTMAAVGRLDLDSGRNGGATVKGWLRNDVLVRARVEAWANTDSEAASLAGKVQVSAAGGQVRASGPDTQDRTGWSVSYEVFVPQNTDVTLNAHNGGLGIQDVRGRIEFHTQNGGVKLARVAGEVSGGTTNGGLHIELAGNSWDGRQLEASTTNGGITIAVPETYSAHFQVGVVNGGIRSDFPMTMQGNLRPRDLDFKMGSGGALIKVNTTNGGVSLKRL